MRWSLLLIVALLGLGGCTGPLGRSAPAAPKGVGTVSGAGVETIDTLSFAEQLRVQEEIISRQQKRIEILEREMETLKRQEYHDQSLRRFTAP